MADFGLGSWPSRRARIDPDAVALRQNERTLTYAELAARVERLAAALTGLGVRPGDRVAFLGANDIATFEVFFAAARLGAVFVPYNYRLTAPEIAYLIEDSEPVVLVYAPACSDLLGSTAPAGVRLVALGPEYDSLCTDEAGSPVGATVGLDDDLVILYTSGTTGRPKGAVLSHGNVTFNTMNQLAHADVLSTDTALCMCPLFHATGLGQVSLPTFFKGGTVVVLPAFDAGVVLRTIAELGIASFSAVPTMLQMLCDHPDFERVELSSLRYAIYGGSTVSERVARAWQRRDVQLLQGYGMTEASPGVYLAAQHGAAERPMSIGVPHFFTDVGLVPDTRQPAPGETGELLVRGLNVFRRYWNRPAETEQAMADGWYRTGDVVRVDKDGWAYVVDRVSDLVISGGENISPSEVEAAINALPGVVDSAVIAVPDERWGEVGMAFVIAADPSAWTAEALRDALAGKIAAYKMPKHVRYVTELPRTATGKVRKQELREALRSQE